MRLEKIIAKAMKNADDDSYILSLMVSKRANELSLGAAPLIKADKNKEKLTDIALREIAEGLIEFDKVVESN
jgi:DNA-directed RNA polymerase subunit omega